MCVVMSISSTALAAPASALARTASGEPTIVVSRRWCSGSACRYTSRAAPPASASQIASITSVRRPSLKFGTQTTSAPVSAIEAEAYDAGMDLDAFQGWLRRYFDAWASNDPAEVSSLFAVDAVYSYGPFREETSGRDAIVRAWVEGGVPTELRTDVEPIAVSGDRGVAHWRVSFRGDAGAVVELDGILVCDFDAADRCVLHREWYDRLETPA